MKKLSLGEEFLIIFTEIKSTEEATHSVSQKTVWKSGCLKTTSDVFSFVVKLISNL